MKKTILLSAFLLCLALVSQGQWFYDNLSEPKAQMGAAALGSKAYFAGGNDDTTAQAAVEIYDINTESWDPIIYLSQGRFFPACVAGGSKVFFAGGIDFYSPSLTCYDNVDIWNTLTQQWEYTLLSVPRFGGGAVNIGDKVMFAGGNNLGMGLSYDLVDIYDTTDYTWSGAHLSQARAAMAYAVIGDLAFFAGGVDVGTGSVSDKVDIYRYSTNSWSTANLSEARAFLAAAAVGSKMLIAGGTNSDNLQSGVVDIYDTLTGIWTTATLSEPRSFSQINAAVTCGNAYFVGGGVLDLNTYSWTSASGTIDIYNWQTNVWTTDNLSEPLFNHEVAGVKDHLIVAGGGISSAPWVTSQVEIFVDAGCQFPSGIPFSQTQTGLLQVYPNPSSDIITVETDSPGHFSILNFSGQEIMTLQVTGPKIQIDISNLPGGIYFVRVTDERTVEFGKFIKE
jgi:hypothetical protein